MRQGHEVWLIAPDYGMNGDILQGKIYRIKSYCVPVDPEDRLMSRLCLRKLYSAIPSLDPDIIHIQTPFVAHYAGLAIAKEFQLPCVETYHTFFEEYLYHYVPLDPRYLMIYAARRFSRAHVIVWMPS